MKKYICKVYWEMCGEVEVEANGETEASLKALLAPLPKSGEYVCDSINCDPDSDVEVAN